MKNLATFHNPQSDLCLSLVQNIHFMVVSDRDQDSRSQSRTCFESDKFSFSVSYKKTDMNKSRSWSRSPTFFSSVSVSVSYTKKWSRPSLVSSPILHFSASGTVFLGNSSLILHEENCSAFSRLVTFLRYLRFWHVVGLGSFSTIF